MPAQIAKSLPGGSDYGWWNFVNDNQSANLSGTDQALLNRWLDLVGENGKNVTYQKARKTFLNSAKSFINKIRPTQANITNYLAAVKTYQQQRKSYYEYMESLLTDSLVEDNHATFFDRIGLGPYIPSLEQITKGIAYYNWLVTGKDRPADVPDGQNSIPEGKSYWQSQLINAQNEQHISLINRMIKSFDSLSGLAQATIDNLNKDQAIHNGTSTESAQDILERKLGLANKRVNYYTEIKSILQGMRDTLVQVGQLQADELLENAQKYLEEKTEELEFTEEEKTKAEEGYEGLLQEKEEQDRRIKELQEEIIPDLEAYLNLHAEDVQAQLDLSAARDELARLRSNPETYIAYTEDKVKS